MSKKVDENNFTKLYNYSIIYATNYFIQNSNKFKKIISKKFIRKKFVKK
jgi:hypothetical protein